MRLHIYAEEKKGRLHFKMRSNFIYKLKRHEDIPPEKCLTLTYTKTSHMT